MFAEMTPGSTHTLLLSRKETERNCCGLYRQQKPRSEKICHVSRSKTKDQKNPKTLCLSTCLKFCFKDKVKMEQQMDSLTEGTEGRLRELASKWFIETQVPLIIHNGFFPNWFVGFITRKNAEEILRDKEMGCFLIRLSDKAIGYILSYKGRDRCRHFVINQSETGQFVVCGDSKGHGTVSDLIQYYKTTPIQPFGEYLTSSCSGALNEELYDIIQVSPKEKPLATVRAVNKMQKQHINSETPTRPPKSNKTLEEVPPLPRRSRHLDCVPLNDQDRVMYAHLMKLSPRETPRAQNICPGDNTRRAQRPTTQDQTHISRCSPLSGLDSAYSELPLLESNKSRSLPFLDSTYEGEYNKLSLPPHTPPRHSPRPARQENTCVLQSHKTDLCNRQSTSHSLDYMSDAAVYHLAGKPGSSHKELSETRLVTSGQHINSVYAEVSNEVSFTRDNTYELVPDHQDTVHPKTFSNTYEPLEDIRPKPVKNDNGKWKWLFPDAKRKW
ncbi:SH2 domain-containing protein 7 [Channa argus]|uniref:SH2 domain-containing protein 7 n=1 Tax=Channa argus TaxID=215402 RepID=A0A6G1PER0_CHAAH|nr:SH2 domain-containing protein 7 [Channa argus]KAK2917828.1 hypothetical protein Q8A73_004574 [Channa argus]